jgi:hypothetical protein
MGVGAIVGLVLALIPLAVSADAAAPSSAVRASSSAVEAAAAPAQKPPYDQVTQQWIQAAKKKIAAKPTVSLAQTAVALCPSNGCNGQVWTRCGWRWPAPAQSQPYETWSRYTYITNSVSPSTDMRDLYTMGYDQGCASDTQRGTSTSLRQMVIIDFGDPGWLNSPSDYGAWQRSGCETCHSQFTRIGSETSGDTIEWSVDRFMQGFWDGTYTTDSFMTIMVGTNNHSLDSIGSTSWSYNHGLAWANMVNHLNNVAIANGWAVQERIEGADDIETSYSTFNESRAWVNGFSAAGTDNNGIRPSYFNYGDAECSDHGFGGCGTFSDWNTGNVYWVSWGALPAYAVPEIYYPDAALQWYWVSLWGPVNGLGPIHFTCAFAEPIDTQNSYLDAWNQLQNAVNGDSRTYIGRISYTSEINYTNP